MDSLVLFSYLLPDLWSLNCQKLCPSFNFFADIRKISKAVITINVYASGSSHFALLGNGIL